MTDISIQVSVSVGMPLSEGARINNCTLENILHFRAIKLKISATDDSSIIEWLDMPSCRLVSFVTRTL